MTTTIASLMLASFLTGGFLFALRAIAQCEDRSIQAENEAYRRGFKVGQDVGWNIGRDYEFQRRNTARTRDGRFTFKKKML